MCVCGGGGGGDSMFYSPSFIIQHDENGTATCNSTVFVEYWNKSHS